MCLFFAYDSPIYVTTIQGWFCFEFDECEIEGEGGGTMVAIEPIESCAAIARPFV